ncbi:MAG: hypothetical protein EPO64_08335 [Nitrospirae bacterium]|nr:MAG: hypothetical protein EPO64_08335 [Nitrospirota bacterium]
MSRYSLRTILTILSISFCAVSLVWANPAMLPKHPGYPGGNAVSPVNGQPLANDPGQTNASGEKALREAAAADDGHVGQNLTDENNQRIIRKEGAGQLPKVQGPDIKVEPPVKEATRMK